MLSVLQVIEELRGLQPICKMPEAIKQDIQNVVPSTQREFGPVAQAVVEEIEDSPRKQPLPLWRGFIQLPLHLSPEDIVESSLINVLSPPYILLLI